MDGLSARQSSPSLGDRMERKGGSHIASAVLNFQIIPDTIIFFLYYQIFGSLGGSELEAEEWRISAESKKVLAARRSI